MASTKTKTEKIKAPRGTQDILPDKGIFFKLIELNASDILESAGFEEISTPIFESTALFSRAVGEDSDIVNKEMYTFLDRSDRSLTLRPEGTAAVVRSFIENSMDRAQKPVKLWYQGPMFRYERPQAGRYRQFHQIGIEAFGSAPPYIDLEVINLGWTLIENLGFGDLTLHINTLGSQETRDKYRDVLKDFLKPLQDKVCEDCQRRYKENPLRALDCKVPADQKLYEGAPDIIECLDPESQKIWDETLAGLDAFNINYEIDPRLVRGLDYYSHVVFEVKVPASSKSKVLGAQNTVLAGGRYDKLVENLGGKETPAVGWALGMERLALLMEDKKEHEEGYLAQNAHGIFVVSDEVFEGQKLAIELRDLFNYNMPVHFDFDCAKLPKQLDKANKKNARFAVFYMQSERESGALKLKDLETGDEHEDLDLEQLVLTIEEIRSAYGRIKL